MPSQRLKTAILVMVAARYGPLRGLGLKILFNLSCNTGSFINEVLSYSKLGYSGLFWATLVNSMLLLVALGYSAHNVSCELSRLSTATHHQ